MTADLRAHLQRDNLRAINRKRLVDASARLLHHRSRIGWDRAKPCCPRQSASQSHQRAARRSRCDGIVLDMLDATGRGVKTASRARRRLPAAGLGHPRPHEPRVLRGCIPMTRASTAQTSSASLGKRGRPSSSHSKCDQAAGHKSSFSRIFKPICAQGKATQTELEPDIS